MCEGTVVPRGVPVAMEELRWRCCGDEERSPGVREGTRAGFGVREGAVVPRGVPVVTEELGLGSLK